MSSLVSLQFVALASMLPLGVAAVKGVVARNVVYWFLLAAAVLCTGIVSWHEIEAGWRPDLAANLWVSISMTLAVFSAISIVRPEAHKLSALLLPYLITLAVFGLVLSKENTNLGGRGSVGWFEAHILLAVASYGVLTIGAIAGFAVLLQERALKLKTEGWTTTALPTLVEAEALQLWLMAWAAGLMAAALASGTAVELLEKGHLFEFTHKILFSLLAFGLIITLLVVHQVTGLRGRRAARIVLTIYLLLSLAYPGVKFVRDVLLA